MLESLHTISHLIFSTTLQGSVNSIFQIRCCGSERLNELFQVTWLIRGEAGITFSSNSKLCSLHCAVLNVFDWMWKYDLYRTYVFPHWAQGLFGCLLLSAPQLPSLMMPKNLIDSKFMSTLEAKNKFMNHIPNVKPHYIFILKSTGLIKLVTTCGIETIYRTTTMCQRYYTHFTEMDMKASRSEVTCFCLRLHNQNQPTLQPSWQSRLCFFFDKVWVSHSI